MNSSRILKSSLGPDIPAQFSSDAIFKELQDTHCSFLKKGTSRKVYDIKGTEYVLKVAIKKENIVCNWTEIVAFHAFDNDQAKLGRVFSWSVSGKFLVMEKLNMQSHPGETFNFPTWVNDRKYSNVGKAEDGTYKICDYALVITPSSPEVAI